MAKGQKTGYFFDQRENRTVIVDAALDTLKILLLVEFRMAGKDHPVIHRADEGEHLKFAILEMRSRK
ncbi:class I SAM-dependent rRNA methyltransferase [Brockia lithotrophica]|uniref:class I SAM-dependent rRNA methyltransferase n=1 Tax=Brockia lithotrophica TaxID=933949 RepID=UPI000EB15501